MILPSEASRRRTLRGSLSAEANKDNSRGTRPASREVRCSFKTEESDSLEMNRDDISGERSISKVMLFGTRGSDTQDIIVLDSTDKSNVDTWIKIRHKRNLSVGLFLFIFFLL